MPGLPPTASATDNRLRRWRAGLADTGTMRPTDLDELEAHMRDVIDKLASTGLSPEEAFLVASRRLGTAGGLTTEFAKVNVQGVMLVRPVEEGDERSRVADQTNAGHSPSVRGCLNRLNPSHRTLSA